MNYLTIKETNLIITIGFRRHNDYHKNKCVSDGIVKLFMGIESLGGPIYEYKNGFCDKCGIFKFYYNKSGHIMKDIYA